MEAALKVYENRMQKIPTSTLDEVMQKAWSRIMRGFVRGDAVK